MDENFKKFIELEEKIKELEAQKKELSLKILEDYDFNSVEIGEKRLVRIKRQMVGIVPGKEDEVMVKFPEAIKTSMDTAKLKKIPEAWEYLEIKVTEFLQVKKAKSDEDEAR